MHNVEIIDIKSFSFKKISLYIQLVLMFGILIIGVSFFFFKDTKLLINILYGILALTMLVMAYNNKVFYKRKRMSLVYIIISIILIASLIKNII